MRLECDVQSEASIKPNISLCSQTYSHYVAVFAALLKVKPCSSICSSENTVSW